MVNEVLTLFHLLFCAGKLRVVIKDLCEKLDTLTTGIDGTTIQTDDLVINSDIKLI